MPTYYRLDLFAEDGTTLLTDFSTDPAHPRPYLRDPENLVGQEIDLAAGTAKIGSVTVEIVDVPSIAGDNDSGVVTAILPTITKGTRAQLLANRDGAGYVNVLRGVVDDAELHDSYSSYPIRLKDEREVERRTRAFTRTTTSSVIPRGVIDGFGYNAESGIWLVAPVTPLRGTVGTFVDVLSWAKIDFPVYPRDAQGRQKVTDPNRIITAKQRAQFNTKPATFGVDVVLGHVAPNLRLLFRTTLGAGAYSVWESIGGLFNPSILITSAGIYNGVDVDVLDALHFDWHPPSKPADGTQVEVIIGYKGPASEDYPFHFEGAAGTLLANLYNAVYSDSELPVRFDAATVAALTEQLRVRVTEPLEDERGIWQWVEENIYAPLSAAPALDINGRISPVRATLPDVGEVLLELDDTNCEPAPAWNKSPKSAINSVTIKYPRLYRVNADDDPLMQRSAGDGLAVAEGEARYWLIESIAQIGEKPLELECETLAAIAGVDGQPQTGDVADEYGAQIARRKGREVTDRFGYGAQVFGPIRVMASAWGNRRVGTWVIANCSWWPDFGTARRGANRLAQAISVTPLTDDWVEVTVIDAGDNAAPVAAPTLGAPVLSGDVMQFLVTPAAGTLARAEYAINDTLPANDSPLWRFLDRVDVATTLSTPPLPAGSVAWRRARGEQINRRPSAWSTPVSVAVPATPRITNVRLAINDQTGAATVTWDRNALTLGIRLHHVTTVDVSAVAGSYTFPAGTVRPGETFMIEVEPWTGWTGTAVSGTAGTRVTVQATRQDPTGLSLTLFDLVVVAQTDTSITWRATAGANVAGVFVYDKLDAPITPTDLPVDQINPDENRHIFYTALIPGETHFRSLMFQPYSSDLTIGTPWRTTIYPQPAQAPVIEQDDIEDGRVGTLWIKVYDRGIAVTDVKVQTQVGTSPLSAKVAPARTAGAASVVNGGTLGLGEYEHDVTLDTFRQSWIVFTLTLETGELMTVVSPGFDQNRVPDFATEPSVSGTRITINGDADTVAIKVERVGGGTWVRTIDNWNAVVDVALTDPSANPGLASGATASYRVTLYSDPIADIDVDTLVETRDIQVTNGTGTEPVWDTVSAAPPAIGSSQMSVTLDASAAPGGYTAKVWARYYVDGAWTDFSDVTASLSPALTTPPTSATAYTLSTPYTRIAKDVSQPILSVEVRAEIRNASNVVVANQPLGATSWYRSAGPGA